MKKSKIAKKTNKQRVFNYLDTSKKIKQKYLTIRKKKKIKNL